MNRLTRLAIRAGTFAPPLFGLILLTLTIIQHDFLRSLGWDPVTAPTFDWPSGLALGRLGWIMTGAFVVNGALIGLFAIALGRALPASAASRLGTLLMLLAGLAMCGLAFTTDPTIRSTPATWHGRIHDASFAALGLTLFPSMLTFGAAFLRSSAWRGLGVYTLLTAALAIPTFALKGIAFYVFLAAILAWMVVTARWLARVVK
ncbi:MAG: DUF998 domain-containing protein [Chloroflexota bacterium]